LLRLIIDVSCSADLKTKSRWSQALKYVRLQRKERATSAQQFARFLNRHGGVAGCASRMATPVRRPCDGWLGYGFRGLPDVEKKADLEAHIDKPQRPGLTVVPTAVANLNRPNRISTNDCVANAGSSTPRDSEC
jgi:hypothetical protein